VEPVVTLPWNGWKVSRGITGKFAVEYPQNAQKAKKAQIAQALRFGALYKIVDE
jgi:hypothetical protein